MTKNIHYKTVDAFDLPLHDADVSPIGSTRNTLEQARLTAELFFPGYTLPTRQIEEADLA
ncbi:hypothetical protein [Pseudomonas fluorescens group sp. PF-69]